MTKEDKTQIVIDNYFKSECDVNTSIRKAFEKGFRIGAQKGSVAAEPVKHGHWVVDEDGNIKCSECGHCGVGDNYCERCGAKMEDGDETN